MTAVLLDRKTKIREELSEIQRELRKALWEIINDVGDKLTSEERAAIQQEFDELNELLDRSKSGKVWLALVGKTNVGKSSVINALLGNLQAAVSVLKDSTTVVTTYERDPWVFVDLPGIMGKPNLEQLALHEAKKACGVLIVLEDEPFEDELEAFEIIRQELPDLPMLVFVNKWDRWEQTATQKDREQVRHRISEKMAPFVKSEGDIIYGSAMRRATDPSTGEESMVLQELPQLVERMYEDAGLLGEVMALVDPAGRAVALNDRIRKKILDVRIRFARKVINAFGVAAIASGFVPFNQLLVLPGVYASMIFTVFKVMGKTIDRGTAGSVASQLLGACGQVLGLRVAALVAGDILLDSLLIATGPFGAILGVLATGSALSYFTYNRTVLLGEVAIEFILNDCTWGAEGQEATIRRCEQRVKELYFSIKRP
jgi:small GTP-binding protein